MYTLYIDTHADKNIMVLYLDNKVLVKKESISYSTMDIPLLKELLDEQNINIKDIKEIIVVNGPGSFTGIRIGVTIAKTLAYTLNIPIKVMSSLLIKAVSFDHDDVVIIEREKNGVFKGVFTKDNNLIEDYQYIHNKDYKKSNKDIEDIGIDYERIISYAKYLPNINPHLVNPLYVKKIEVQK